MVRTSSHSKAYVLKTNPLFSLFHFFLWFDLMELRAKQNHSQGLGRWLRCLHFLQKRSIGLEPQLGMERQRNNVGLENVRVYPQQRKLLEAEG